jgi:hypothetical protein
MANQDGDGFLNRVYKNLFVSPADLESIESEVSIEKLLDRKDGIYDTAANKNFNLDTKGNIFSGIADVKETGQVSKSSKNKKQTKSTVSNSGSNIFNSDILDRIDLNRGEKPSELGNIFDQLS